MAERGGLFRGAIEDRYVGAFFDEHAVRDRAREARRSDRVAEVHRDAARRGAVELREPADLDRRAAARQATPIRSAPYAGRRARFAALHGRADVDQELLPARRRRAHRVSGRRATAGCSTSSTSSAGAGPRSGSRARWKCRAPRRTQPHARATRLGRHVCAVLSPRREIKVFAEGAEMFTFRGADWHLLDLQAKYGLWADAVGRPALARRLFQTALDLADAREGALFVVAAPADRVAVAAGRRRRPARHGAARPGVGSRHAVAAATCCTCSRAAR